MLQKHCACHEKVEPRHTNSCNCHAKWPLQSNISVTWNLQPFHGFSVRGFKHRHHRARNPCACHATSIISDPLQIHHACQRFCNPHKLYKLLRLPRILQRVEIPAPATRKAAWTSKSAPSTWRSNDLDFRMALARGHGANFGDIVSSRSSAAEKICRSSPLSALPGKYRYSPFSALLHPRVFRSWLSKPAKPQNYGKTLHFAQFLPAKTSCHTSLLYHICAITSLGWQIFGGNSQYSRKLDSKTSFDYNRYHNQVIRDRLNPSLEDVVQEMYSRFWELYGTCWQRKVM